MKVHEEYNLPIPDSLIDQIADSVAEKVIARMLPHLAKFSTAVPTALQLDSDRPQPTFLRLSDLVERLGVSRGSIYRWVSEGRFPQSVSHR